ncbi:hypothetical protein Sme01_50420 [Sphaerisporangium melleum]|uniref:Uncharacterized protein n=1 Tax=Sphaerisporangium melleum TaxID=321316 RepID=A0A917R4H8_9ACTN|nr:hypothetical protein [Sphaerisporangium melleum]GGK89997.1 hypothetical protein GCM10007964_35830 [Sphaerisporangium melleum]GII72566.1 hypothetical protein Sme01_50420 [Sphaerisporangium melleum]
MSERPDDLERRMDALRGEIRRAVRARESVLARSLRAELRRAEHSWQQELTARDSAPVEEHGAGPEDRHDAPGTGRAQTGRSAPDTSDEPAPHTLSDEPAPHALGDGPATHALGDRAASRALGGGGAPGARGGAAAGVWRARVVRPGATGREGASPAGVREQVCQALTLIGVPAAARVVVALNAALGAAPLRSAQIAVLRRDEERSFRAAPHARPYYMCAALTDRLSAARGLLALSTWPLERRAVGPLSPRVDFLITAIRLAEHLARMAEAGERPSPAAHRLLSRLAHNIPGIGERQGTSNGYPRTRHGPGGRTERDADGPVPGGRAGRVPGARGQGTTPGPTTASWPAAGVQADMSWPVSDGEPDRFAAGSDGPDPAAVVRAARAELEVHAAGDAAARAEIARRAREALPEAGRLFGVATTTRAARRPR